MEFCVAGWAENSCVRRDAVVWRYACSVSAGVHYFSMGSSSLKPRSLMSYCGGRVLAVYAVVAKASFRCEIRLLGTIAVEPGVSGNLIS